MDRRGRDFISLSGSPQVGVAPAQPTRKCGVGGGHLLSLAMTALKLPGYKRVASSSHSMDCPFLDPHTHPTNEDRCFNYDKAIEQLKLCNPQPPHTPLTCAYGVMDGHGGYRASAYLKHHLPRMILRSDYFESLDVAADEALSMSVEEGISDCEESFMKFAREERESSGACLTVVIVRADLLCCANVGDCQAGIINEAGEIKMLTHPHRASNPEEAERIQKAKGSGWHGKVVDDRVMGVLEPSRTIGDRDMKVRFPETVIPTPHIVVQSLGPEYQGSKATLLLASDGVWDYLKTDAAVNIVHNAGNDQNSLDDAACALCKAASSSGSADDITAVIVRFWGE